MKNAKYIYIYTPAWRENSAGIRVLHYLCDYLNRLGYKAFLVIHNPRETNKLTNPNLTTPVLTKTLSRQHHLTGVPYVTVYTETVVGNPLKSPNVIRYLLNYPGALGGSNYFNQSEILIAYSLSIASKEKKEIETLFIPAIKSSDLPPRSKKNPNLKLIYAGKYRAFVGKPIHDLDGEVIEIFRDGPFRQDRTTVLDLLSRASVLYCWENSTIATEAILLGTPCIFVKNKFLNEIIGMEELGQLGFEVGSWMTHPREAIETLDAAHSRFMQIEANLPQNIDETFSQLLCRGELAQLSVNPCPVPSGRGFINIHRFRIFMAIAQNKGYFAAIRAGLNFVGLRKSYKFKHFL